MTNVNSASNSTSSTSSTSNEKFDGPRKNIGARYRSNEFDSDFVAVFLEQPFLGVISLEITKLADEGCRTAYLSVVKQDNQYEFVLGYNPDFFRSLTPSERRGVICHELYHLIFGHITHRVVFDNRMAQIWNVATDLAINSIIGDVNLPKMCLMPGKRPMRQDPKTGVMIDAGDKDICDFIEKAPPLMAADFYFEKMKEIIKKREDNDDDPTGGMATLDDHEIWEQLPSEIEEYLAEKMRDIIEKAVRHADNTRSWGNIPAEISEMIRKMLSREIDWTSVVKSFVGRCRSVERIGTIRRLNKRAMYLLPGARRKEHANFACFIDQSGSMSDNDIAMLFGELEGLAKEVSIDVYSFDTEVDEESLVVWKKGRPCPVKTYRRTRCGGTDFNAVAEFCNRKNRGKWSGVIILTDGYAPVMAPIIGARTLWVITPEGTLDNIRPGDLVCKMKSGNGQFQRR